MLVNKKLRNYRIAFLTVVLFAIYLILPSKPVSKKFPAFGGRMGDVTASSEYVNMQQAAEQYRFEIRQNPDVVKNYVQLAQLYLQQSRITGRHHEYVSEAQKLLNEVLKREPEDFEAMITQASIYLKLHQFDRAKEVAEKALAKNSFNAFAWGALSDAKKELGDYAGAVEACDKMLSIRPDLRSYSRAAHLREIHGDLAGARKAMRLACDAGVTGLESRAWALYQLGNLYFKEGKLDTAEFIYKGILEERPNYPFAISGLASVDFAQKNYKTAAQKLLQAYEIAPEHEFMEKLVKVYRVSGKTETANDLMAMLIDGFEQHEAQGWNINLEYARFCLGNQIDLTPALDRMESEYLRRPHNVDVLETYAWALYKNNQFNDSQEIILKALRLNPHDARMNYTAGKIAEKLGQQEKAKTHFVKAGTIFLFNISS